MGELKRFAGGRVVVKAGDITEEAVDVIVNAANGSLMGGGGVDGAIHRAGGKDILAECKEIRRSEYPDGFPTGRAVITTAGKMMARFVIHTVGPVYSRGGPDKARQLADCYRNSLALAVEKGLTTVAFPAISTGIYGYPQDEAARVASKAIEESLVAATTIKEVALVFFSKEDADVFLKNHSFTS
jgi:O-acetyl-ADP-ribose deacetylase (regulator of RNase III)